MIRLAQTYIGKNIPSGVCDGTLVNENVKWQRKLSNVLRDPCLAKTMAAQKF